MQVDNPAVEKKLVPVAVDIMYEAQGLAEQAARTNSPVVVVELAAQVAHSNPRAEAAALTIL